MNKIILLDLSKDINLKIKNSFIFQLSYGSCNLENCKIIKNNFFTDKKLELFKSQLNISFFKFYQFLKNQKNNNEILTLELFNQRNDKNQLFNKIFNITEIINFSKINKISDIEIITDDTTFYETYRSIKYKNISVKLVSKKKVQKHFIWYFLTTFKFHLKALIIIIFAKIFINKIKIKSAVEICLSIFPLFYRKGKEDFFKKNFLKLNFQITDETHLGNSLLKNISDIFKIRKLNNILSAESLISFYSIIQNFLKSIRNYSLIKKTNNYKFIVNGIDCSVQFQNLFFNSIHNFNKLNIYEKDLKKFFKYNKINQFHYYLFEYNFGYYLCNLIKKNSPKTIISGYQHGIYSERLMWQNLSKKVNFENFFPNKINCKYRFSLEAYKKNFKKIKIYYKKSNNFSYKPKKNKSTSNQFIVYLGLHDSYNMINELRNLNKDYQFVVNLHPKMKFENKLNLNSNIKFNFEKNVIKNKKKLLSSTSTMPYQLYSREQFKIIVPNNIIPLNPKSFDKFIFKSK